MTDSTPPTTPSSTPAAATTAPTTGSRARRRRKSVGFPVLALPEVVDLLRELVKYGRTHTLAAMAGYMGHATDNSGPFRQKLAALKDWGVVVSKGSDATITETGVNLAIGDNPDEQRSAGRKAFLAVPTFAKMYQDAAKGVSVERDRLATKAVVGMGVSAGMKEVFVNSLIESAVAVGLADVPDKTHVRFLAEGPLPEPEASAADGSSPALITAPPRNGAALTPVLRQVWTVPDGEILLEIRLRRPLPASSFAQLGKLVTELEVLADTFVDTSAEPADAPG